MSAVLLLPMAISLHTVERKMWEVLLAFLMLCGGTAVLVLLYMWFTWYASLYAMRLRVRVGINNGGSIKGGLSRSEIQRLPKFICTSQVVEPEGDENVGIRKDGFFVTKDLDCAVCLDPYKDGERCLVMPTCGHCFHVVCAEAWLSKQPRCPVCRASALPKEESQQLQSLSNDIPDTTIVIDIQS